MGRAAELNTTPATLALATRRARKGIKKLDEKRKSWRRTVRAAMVKNGVKLELDNPNTCILGLTYMKAAGFGTGYGHGLEVLFNDSLDSSREHGFEQDPRIGIRYDILQKVWECELIRENIVPIKVIPGAKC